MRLALVALAFALALACAAIVLGGWLFWRRRRLRRFIPPLELKALIPESRFIEIDGLNIHYVQAGRGADLVLLHGIGASVFAWRFLLPLLETHFRVTAIDLPGFGKSGKSGDRDYGLDAQTRAVNDALKALKIGPATLVGSSMGGVIALWLAKCFPEKFTRIVTLAPATDPRLVPEAIHHLDALIPFLRRALNRHTMRAILKRVIARHELINDDVIDSYLSPFLDDGSSVRAFWLATRLIADRRIPKELSGLKARVLIIYGDRDLRVPRRVIDQLTRTLPNSTLLTHEGGGHHIMEDEPLWTAETIVKFVSENS